MIRTNAIAIDDPLAPQAAHNRADNSGIRPKIKPPMIGPVSVPLPSRYHHDDHGDGVDKHEDVRIDDANVNAYRDPA